MFGTSDDHLATPDVAALARREQITLDQRFSGHTPLAIEYDFALCTDELNCASKLSRRRNGTSRHRLPPAAAMAVYGKCRVSLSR